MTEPTSTDGSLAWVLPAGSRHVYEYTHHRVVTSGAGFTKVEGVADRRAEFVLAAESPGEIVRVTMTNIHDSGHSSDLPVERLANAEVYPVVVFDRNGRILENSSPPTFPLTFSPELAGLSQGGRRSADFSAPLKSGFGRCTAQGTVITAWEDTEVLDGSLCAVVVTTFDLQSVPGGRFWSPDPPRFRGQTIVHFDLEAGRLALLTSSSQLEQTLGWKRIRQDLHMTVRYLSG